MSKWSDTVMSEYKIKTLLSHPLKRNPAHEGFPLRGVVAKAQAEITGKIMYDDGFKAGYKEGVKNHHECCKMDYKAGIREVVEWMIPNFLIDTDNKSAFAGGQISLERWQAKLKDWRLESEKG